jgi:3-methyladenine DNA glycosylase AlkD
MSDRNTPPARSGRPELGGRDRVVYSPRPARFMAALEAISSPDEVEKVGRFFKGRNWADAPETKIMGVSIGRIFPVAKRFIDMGLAEIEELLESEYYEVRMGAVAIMDFQARERSTPGSRRKALFELYIRRHDRIDNWDLVDRAAPHVIGEYLLDRPRDILYQLARSQDPWERRSAIVSTRAFIRAGQVEDTFRLAEILIDDEHDLVQKAIGSWVREAGKKGAEALYAFLDRHAGRMSRTALRYAIEKLEGSRRAHYLAQESDG